MKYKINSIASKTKNHLNSNSINYYFFLVFFHFVFNFNFSVSRHFSYLTSINDLGLFDQAIWGINNGSPFLNTFLFKNNINVLGLHFFPIISIFTPLYKIYPTPVWFLFFQSLALSTSSFLIFKLASVLKFTKNISILFGIIYLLDFRINNTAQWDFHEISIAVPLIVLTFIAIETQNYTILTISLLSLSLCKEHFGLAILGFGVLYIKRSNEYIKGSLVCMYGLLHIYLVIFKIMPALSNFDKHIMLMENMGQLSRYSWLVNQIEKPSIDGFLTSLKFLFFRLKPISYLLSLFFPFLMLPLFSPVMILPAIGDISANALSANPMPRAIFAYHNATISTVLLIATIVAMSKNSSIFKSFKKNKVIVSLLLVHLIFGYVFSPYHFPYSLNIWGLNSYFASKDATLLDVKNIVKNESISVQSNIGSFFTQRKSINTFPSVTENNKYIVLHLRNPSINNRSTETKIIGSLYHHLQMNPLDYIEEVESILKTKSFGVIFWQEPWLVLKRGSTSSIQPKEIFQRLQLLRTEWNL